jgi:hypothetical protein
MKKGIKRGLTVLTDEEEIDLWTDCKYIEV